MLYTNQNIRVQWGATLSNLCTVSNVVKQGGVMSPILFTIYIDQLLCQLRESNLGCHIGREFYGALGYADDIILLNPTLYSLRAMLEICSNFAESYDVKFNPTKSKLLYFGSNEPKSVISPISFMGGTIEIVPYETYLGNIIGQNPYKFQMHDALI